MLRKLLIALCLFAGATVAYLSISGGPTKVHVATIVPWFTIALAACLAAWSPLSSSARVVSLAFVALGGAGLHLYANTAFFGKMEPTLGAYLAFLVLTLLVVAGFLALIAGLARLTARWWPPVTRG